MARPPGGRAARLTFPPGGDVSDRKPAPGYRLRLSGDLCAGVAAAHDAPLLPAIGQEGPMPVKSSVRSLLSLKVSTGWGLRPE